MSSTLSREQIDELLSRSPDELLAALGAAHHGSFPGDLVRKGTKQFTVILRQSRQAVCASPLVRQYAEADDRYALVAAVADLLLSRYGQLAAATAATLMVKTGVTEMCSAQWRTGRGDEA